jgi:hypothetical protein
VIVHSELPSCFWPVLPYDVNGNNVFLTNSMISGAMDQQVRVMNIEREELLTSYVCHRGRVKDVITHATNPSIYWSAGWYSFQFSFLIYFAFPPVTCSVPFFIF